MKRKLFLSIMLVSVCVFGYAQNKKYYINGNSPVNGGGSDSNNGLSKNSAWLSITPANSINFQPGDSILLFSAGSWINGSFSFDQNDVGTPANPVVISTYGPNPTANVWTGDNQGFFGGNTGAVKIENIHFYGGRTFGGGSNTNNGINFYTEGSLTGRPYIYINNCRLEGFGKQGILIQSWNHDASTTVGFKDITITNSIITNCGRSGINIGAFGDAVISSNFVHKNVLIQNVRARGNAGDINETTVATGNGIVVSSSQNVVIDNCVADQNGALNNHAGAGIAGIWFYDVKDGIIKNSESFNNSAGVAAADGNGFGIDGGCQNCTIEHCYSHDNDGTGFGLFEFGSPNQHQNNTIRYNISQNDARANTFGGLFFWGASANHTIINDNVYNNTVYLNAANLYNSGDLPVGVKVLGNNMSNIKVANNIFYLSDASLSFTRTVSLINQPMAILPTQLLMVNNLYYNSAAAGTFGWGSNYNTLAAWRTGTNQEKYNSVDYGAIGDPKFSNPGGAGQVAPVVMDGGNQTVGFPGDVKTITQYKTTSPSSAMGTGANLNSLFAINIGTNDYYGYSLTTNSFDIGAYQSNTPLPLASLKSFSLIKSANGNKLIWVMTEVEKTSNFILESSNDGSDFKNLSNSISTTKSLTYSYLDSSPSKTITYYRLKGVDSNGEVWYSNIVVAQKELSIADFSVYPVPLNNSNIVFDWDKKESVTVTLSDLSGKIVFRKTVFVTAGNNQINLKEVDSLPNGVYFINLFGASNKSFSRKVVK
jgi:hypothetical protein